MAVAISPAAPTHGVPRRGYVLSTAVEQIAGPARTVVRVLQAAFTVTACIATPYVPPGEGPEPTRVAWHAFSAWLLYLLAGARGVSLTEAQQWYLGRELTAAEREFWHCADAETVSEREEIAGRDGIRELLPYILESHGPGSRLSVRHDPSTQTARTTKKASGVFYTPPDVAEFMARTALHGRGPAPKVLDPAVGTGVFLRAVLRELRGSSDNAFLLAQNTLFGCDIDVQALDGTATVILADVLPDALEVLSTPYEAWQALRSNLRQCDTLMIDPESESEPPRAQLATLFPSAHGGFDLTIGNPPYTDLGPRRDMPALISRFRSIAAYPRSTAELYTVFIEQMVRLSTRTGAGALVLPLSLACNTGSQFDACRNFISGEPGVWRFAFFDRQPHALFGEDVKTRNAILFWERGARGTTISTGPLRKWRGGDRQAMLARIDYTPISGNIAAGIPKLHGPIQTAAWEHLKHCPGTLASLTSEITRASLSSLPFAAGNEVFVAPTAYNFLGVARPCRLTTGKGETLSANPMFRLVCASEDEASAVYAVLSSNLAFWWWHVNGDGFHVNRSTLRTIPAVSLTGAEAARAELAKLGEEMWEASRCSPVRSLNRGRVSYTFSAAAAPGIRKRIDRLLIRSFGLPEAFASELEDFTETITQARVFVPHKQITTGKAGMKISNEVKEKSKLTKEEWKEYTKTVWSIANKARPDHPAVFPEEIPHRLTKLFSFYGETVLDPFAGSGSTARAAIPLGRRTVCVEQNPEYASIIQTECAKLRNGYEDNFASLEVVRGDSRNLNFLKNDSVGLVVTSPPYWNKADYGTGEDNLGNIASYAEFLSGIQPVFRECYRVLEPGRKMCVITANVNQQTEHGLLTFPLATDFAVMLRDIGFVMVNEIIWSKDRTGGKWGSFGTQRPIFGSYPYPPNFLFKNIHEYVLIFAKPALTKRKGPKVRNYGELMEGMENASPFVLPGDPDEQQLPMVEH